MTGYNVTGQLQVIATFQELLERFILSHLKSVGHQSLKTTVSSRQRQLISCFIHTDGVANTPELCCGITLPYTVICYSHWLIKAELVL